MRRHFWRLSAFLLVTFASIMARGAASHFNALYVFGDSYCDVGNIYAATDGAVPAAPYYHGRFSDGPIWLDHVAGFLGVPMKASLLGGTNYAFGGAWVTAPQAIPGGVIPSVPQQVELYLLQHGGKADPNALYILEGGGNDILNTTSGSPEALGYEIASGIAASERMLRQAGARHFLVPNLFNVGILPAAAGNVAFADAASVATNKWTEILLGNEMNLRGIQILHMDIFSLFNALEKDPTHFGFSDVTNPCLTTTSLCSDPDHRLFWDDHHPTLFGHMMFAVTLENALTSRSE